MVTSDIDIIVALLERLSYILKYNKGINQLAGVKLAIVVLSNNDVAASQRISQARSIFKTMMGGAGTLGDFAIWDENEHRRISLNQELDNILDDLWRHLEC